MRTTLSGKTPEYIGADLTDRYSEGCREIDVCGLTREGSGLRASFWHWVWDRAPQPLDVEAIAAELRAARVAMLDGPQALAKEGASLRVCERQSAAVGKTPGERPRLTRPFAGFICSSLELFAGLRGEGIAISPRTLIGGVFEVYPGHLWTILNGGQPLPRKSTDSGRLARKVVLETLGVTSMPELPTHDQNDAAVAAFLAAVVDNQVEGITAASIGEPLTIDSDGTLREGPMVIPCTTRMLIERIGYALREVPSARLSVRRSMEPESEAPHIGAEELLAHFIAKATEGDPQVCTYGWAYRSLFNASYTKFSMAYARKAIDIACQTRPRELPGLGLVRLDAFVVSKKDGIPSDGYWPTAHHDREEWQRVLGNAKIID